MYRSREVVLLITHSDDYFTIDRVEEALSKKGVPTFRFNTDEFPLNVQLTAQFDNDQSNHRLEYAGQSISTEQVKAVWMRRIWQPKFNQELDPQYIQACTQESTTTLEGFWDSLREARWVDNLEKIEAASNKQRQLRLAKEVGLVIPRTLITNKAEAAREFFQQVEGKMVSKLLSALGYSMSARPDMFLYTSTVQEEDLQDAESLRYCPMVFQEQIPKEKELRVVYVNGKTFVGALNSANYNDASVDWRKPGVEVGAWEHHQLPEEVQNRLQAFMGALGLYFGACDFILTPSGEYVFLEVNPVGEWGMVEKELNLPISSAIADTLIS